MTYLGTFQIRKLVLFSVLPLILSACGGLQGNLGPEEDPQITALKRETRRVSQSNAVTQNAIKDIYGKIDTLETRLARLDERVEEIADREPILITPEGRRPNTEEDQKKPVETATEADSSGQAVKPEPTEPLPKKRATIKKTPASAPKKEPKPEPPEPATQKAYDRAYAAYQDGRYDEALALFKSFLKAHPTDDLSDNAQYWIGEIYYDIDNFPEAILAFKEVVTRYPQGNKAPHALLKIGYAYGALDNPTNARTFLKRVIKNYPFSEAEAMARQKLKELENVAR